MREGTYDSGVQSGMWKYWWASGDFEEVEFVDGIEQADAPLMRGPRRRLVIRW